MSDLPCAWAPVTDLLYRSYHDQEWGVPVRDSRAIWEKLQLDGFQAGLSWITILRKREAMREEFDGFDPERVARWTQKRIDRALKNPGVIRSPQKINALVSNARVYLELEEQGLDFSDHVWSFVKHRPLISRLTSYKNAPAKTVISEQLSKDLKQRGFKFCGPTIVYAVMQAIGMVNDHEVGCPRFTAVQKL
ncbi:MAG TPA: DNA-3-methyladenine glycosylase I [Polyangiales bacterium]|jgi:DNA-3-methyladenine glycosylase I|nr:DNA-3-methyladenine glycosylase I [Polyangiales bacterium]